MQSLTWVAETKMLIFILGRAVNNGTTLTINVLESGGFTLIPQGMVHDDDSFTISVDAYSGPVLPTPILELPTILPKGAMLYSELTYNPQLSGFPTSLIFTIQTDVSLFQGDRFTVFLPLFDSLDKSFSTRSDPLGAVVSGEWHGTIGLANSKTLHFDIAMEIRPRQRITVTVPISANISLPHRNLRPNLGVLTIRSNSSAGAIAEDRSKCPELLGLSIKRLR
jgi:hypothetical protein